MIADPSCERYKPVISVTLADGRKLEWTDSSGAGSYDLTWDIATDMTRQFFAEVGIAATHATALIEAVANVDSLDNISPLLEVSAEVARAVLKAA
ncbi:MAG: hypothetical protein WDN48_15765 [Pseudolabrys sp.]